MTEDKDKKKPEKTNRQLRNESTRADRTPEQSRYALRRKVKMFYDLQRLRIQTAGRTYDRAAENEIELAEVDIVQLERRAEDLKKVEKEALHDIGAHLKTMPVYTEILSDKKRFKGIGVTLAAVIIAEVDIHKAETVSALWRYAGLAPVPCRRCKLCKDEVSPIKAGDVAFKHTFSRTDKCELKRVPLSQTFESARAERPTKGEKLAFNRFFKTKMVGVMADCLLKANSPFRSYYDNYKHRLASGNRGRSDGHRHRMALRYMTKMVLLEIWRDWRELEDLPVRPAYQEEYLGHTHGAA